MPADLQCLVESDEPYALVRLVGSLDPPTARSVRRALLTCLADQPGSVIVDISELRMDEPAALSVFVEVAREAAEWPTGQLLFFHPAADDTPSWATAGLPVVTSLPAAVELLSEPTAMAARLLSAEMEPVVGSARQARDLVTDGCARWDVPELVGSACIAVTEMVNNVVAHANTSMIVRLAHQDGTLHVAVRDYSPVPPVFAGSVPPTSTGGRGLLLIDTVARRWGTSLLADGKVVWAVLGPADEPLS